jgi:hypothetical protein
MVCRRFGQEHTHFDGFPRIRMRSSLVIKAGEVLKWREYQRLVHLVIRKEVRGQVRRFVAGRVFVEGFSASGSDRSVNLSIV